MRESLEVGDGTLSWKLRPGSSRPSDFTLRDLAQIRRVNEARSYLLVSVDLATSSTRSGSLPAARGFGICWLQAMEVTRTSSTNRVQHLFYLATSIELISSPKPSVLRTAGVYINGHYMAHGDETQFFLILERNNPWGRGRGLRQNANARASPPKVMFILAVPWLVPAHDFDDKFAI